jgi:hypothetical protein
VLSKENGDCLDRREKIIAVSVDFKNAYDSDLRIKLESKLQANGGGGTGARTHTQSE